MILSRSNVLTAAILAAGLILPSTANAQKPILTRNADEPGRAPYQQNVFINQTTTSCPNNFYCVVSFDPVPAGYRLVITYASARFSQGTAYSGAYSVLSTDGSLSGPQILVPGGTLVGPDLAKYFSGGALTFYVDAGHSPSILLAGYNILTGLTSQANISGYLVALP